MSEQFFGRGDIVDAQGRKVFQFDSQFAVLDRRALGSKGDLRASEPTTGGSKIHLDGGRPLINVTDASGVTVFRFRASPVLGGESGGVGLLVGDQAAGELEAGRGGSRPTWTSG
jgi:hypothetical protein